jgi:hypothetical protein
VGNWTQLFNQIGEQIGNLERAVTASTDSSFPIREHLLPEALSVFPVETPILNRLMPNALPGSGSAVSWRELTGFTKVGSVFYVETGVPGDVKYTYAPQSAGYKLGGRRFGVTGFARAAGASFEDALVRERQGAIVALKQDLEDAIWNADSALVPAAFDGLLTQIAVANGSIVTPINGALALDDINTALAASWDAGYEVSWLGLNSAQAKQINDLVLNAGTHQITVVRTEQGAVAGSQRVTDIIHPVTGKPVPLIVSRNLAAGTLIGVPEVLPVHVGGRQGQRGLWWDSLLDITEVEEGVSSDAVWYFLKTYAVMPFPARRGAFKLTGLQ